MAVEGDVVDRPGEHVAHLYEHDDELLTCIAGRVEAALRSGEGVVIVAAEARRPALDAALAGRGLDVGRNRREGRLTVLGAEAALADLMVDGRPDRRRFDAVVGRAVRDAAGPGRATVYGEMVAELWEAGEVAAAVSLEELWNDLAEEVTFSLWCGYPLGPVLREDAAAWRDVCERHTSVVAPGSAPSALPASAPHRAESRRFECSPHAAGAARRFAREVLRRWGREADLDDVALIVSELTTNAVLHAQSDVAVSLCDRDEGLRIEVGDADPSPPRRRDPSSDDPVGRGLLLVEALARRWGSDAAGHGKVVWAELGRVSGLVPGDEEHAHPR